jgi:hypothetical protein
MNNIRQYNCWKYTYMTCIRKPNVNYVTMNGH